MIKVTFSKPPFPLLSLYLSLARAHEHAHALTHMHTLLSAETRQDAEGHGVFGEDQKSRARRSRQDLSSGLSNDPSVVPNVSRPELASRNVWRTWRGIARVGIVGAGGGRGCRDLCREEPFTSNPIC